MIKSAPTIGADLQIRNFDRHKHTHALTDVGSASLQQGRYDQSAKECDAHQPTTENPENVCCIRARPNATIEKGYESLRWVFSMPTEDGSGREEFITVRSLSVSRVEVVRGRATRLWLVCKLSDYLPPRSSKIQVCGYLGSFLVSMLED